MDTSENIERTTEEVVKVSKKTGILPSTDHELINLAQTVSANWKNSDYVIPGVTPELFDQQIESLKTLTADRSNAGAKRRPVSKSITDLEKEMLANLYYVKIDLQRHFGKSAAESYYYSFGIKYAGSQYTFPSDRQGKKASLEMLINALKEHSINSAEYGVSYWQNLYDRYKTLTDTAIGYASDISRLRNEKTFAREHVRKTLRAIAGLIKAYNPYTYKLVYREWGYQKELY